MAGRRAHVILSEGRAYELAVICAMLLSTLTVAAMRHVEV
jgi:hypothetical protein